jgi:hypothetical protein
MAASTGVIQKVIDDYEPKDSYQERLKSSLKDHDYIKHDDLLNAMAELAVSPDELAKVKTIKGFVVNPYTGRWIGYSEEAYEKIVQEAKENEAKRRAGIEAKARETPSFIAADKNLTEAREEEAATLSGLEDDNTVLSSHVKKQATQARKTAEIVANESLTSAIAAIEQAEMKKKTEEVAAAQMRETLLGNARSELNWTARDLQERILKIQIYNHIEMLIAFRMAAPVSLPGILMFIISASYGDIDFKNQDVQTTLTIGFVATLGVIGAAWYIKSILHRKWYSDVDQALTTYKSNLDAYVKKYLGKEAGDALTQEIMPLIEANVKYAQHNWYPHIDTDELNWVGFRKTALNGDTTDSPELAHHKDRRRLSSAMTVGINFVGLICGVILAGMAHEKKSYLHSLLNKKPHLPNQPGETPSPTNNDSSDWFSTVFGQEPAFYAVAGLLMLGVGFSAFMGIREYNRPTKSPLLTLKDKAEISHGFGQLKLSPFK